MYKYIHSATKTVKFEYSNKKNYTITHTHTTVYPINNFKHTPEQ